MAMPMDTDASGQAYPGGLPLGLLDPSAAGFPHHLLDPSTALLLSGLAAQHPGAPGSVEALQHQQQLQQFLNPAAFAAAVGQAGVDMKLEQQDGGEQVMAGAGGAGSGDDGGDAAQQQQAAAAALLDPNDPEAVAAALASRIAAVGAVVIFEKSLTASDVSGGGRVVVPKSVAEQYFPKLEQPSGVTISATDLDGRTYTFKWRFWVNNSSRMYLLEGAGELHRNYYLEVGDVMVFAQKPDGSLVVAGRVANKADLVKKPPIKRPNANTNNANAAAAASRGRGEQRNGRAPARTPVAEAAAAVQAAGAAAAAQAVAAAGAAAAAAAACAGRNGGASTPQDVGAGARGRKRKGAVGTGAHGGASDPRLQRGRGGEEEVSLAVLDMEAPSDGVFRAVVLQQLSSVPSGLQLARNNRWTATLDVAGELYQAFFDTRDDAMEALTAAGASP